MFFLLFSFSIQICALLFAYIFNTQLRDDFAVMQCCSNIIPTMLRESAIKIIIVWTNERMWGRRRRQRGFLRKWDMKRFHWAFIDDQWRAISLRQLPAKLLTDRWPECISARPPKTSWARRKSSSTTSSSWPKTSKVFVVSLSNESTFRDSP